MTVKQYKNISVCEDIDECYEGSPCGDLMCVNVAGSYECICPTGFTVVRDINGKLDCNDIGKFLIAKNACSLSAKS